VSEGPPPPGLPAPEVGPGASGRPTSHRASTPVADSVRRFLAPLAAVTAVVVVIVLLLVLNGPGHSSGPGPALQPPPAAVTTTPAPVRTTPAPAAKKPTHHATPRRTPPVEEPPATATAAARKLPVTVLNNSRRTGLAHRAADQLTAGGWPIRQVGNFTGRIPVSTVYYASGQESAARALADQFPAVQRVHPRFRGLPGSGLTLVVTREWPAAGS